MWAQGVGHLEAIKQHGRSCRSCARPWFVPGEIVCAVRSRQGLADDRWALVLLRMWAQGVGHLEAIKQHGRSCRSGARPWFVPGEIVCAVRSRSMKPMWAVSHKAFADVVQTASLSWRSP